MKSTLFCLIVAVTLSAAAHASLQVIDAYYREDVAFPHFDRYWTATPDVHAAQPPTALGSTVHIYVRNTSGKPASLDDVTLEGISLKKAIAYSDIRKYRRYVFAAGIYFSKLPKDQIDKLRNVGEPIWWRFEPRVVKPGEFGELIVRLRYKSAKTVLTLRLIAKNGDGLTVHVPVGGTTPRFKAIRFAPGRKVIYLYLNHPKRGFAPNRILMNGVDITSRATISSDRAVSVVPVVCKLSEPLGPASVQCFQALYEDGSKATSLVRAYDDEFAFGMWGARGRDSKESDAQLARDYINDLAVHNINVQMEMVGSAAVAEFMKSDEGLSLMKSLGIRRMISDPGKGRTKNPWGYFLTDEPDAGDSRVLGLPPGVPRVGMLAQDLVRRTQELHEIDPTTPCLLNIDFTYRPQNWYVYGQVPDILASDPYYQARLGQESEYGKAPEKLDAFKKATYIEGVTTICHSSHAPKPVHIILLAAAGRDRREREITYVPPTEKRIETYYAIGAGASGLSYWWFHGLDPGLQRGDPMAKAQWTEIGLMGAELRTAGPVIITSCPAFLPVTAPQQLWVRTLIRGVDTLVLVCVNDSYTCDTKGINISPLHDVEVEIQLPKWFEPKSVFDVSYKGIQDVLTDVADKSAEPDCSDKKLKLQLGTVDVTRLIFITSDPDLRAELKNLHKDKFARNVDKLISLHNQ